MSAIYRPCTQAFVSYVGPSHFLSVYPKTNPPTFTLSLTLKKREITGASSVAYNIRRVSVAVSACEAFYQIIYIPCKVMTETRLKFRAWFAVAMQCLGCIMHSSCDHAECLQC